MFLCSCVLVRVLCSISWSVHDKFVSLSFVSSWGLRHYFQYLTGPAWICLDLTGLAWICLDLPQSFMPGCDPIYLSYCGYSLEYPVIRDKTLYLLISSPSFRLAHKKRHGTCLTKFRFSFNTVNYLLLQYAQTYLFFADFPTVFLVISTRQVSVVEAVTGSCQNFI